MDEGSYNSPEERNRTKPGSNNFILSPKPYCSKSIPHIIINSRDTVNTRLQNKRPAVLIFKISNPIERY